jgi:predicted metalloprotease
MRWENLPGGGNVEDRRGEEGGGGHVVLGLLGWALGIDPRLLIGGAEILSGGGSQVQQADRQPIPRRKTTPQDEMGKFVDGALNSADIEWQQMFARSGRQYRRPVLVLYRNVTEQACGGVAQKAMGPFYCPADQKIYLDTSFFREIEQRFRGCQTGSPSCRFAQAYVIAHEIGHHVQNLLGILPEVQQRQRLTSKAEANQLQVRVELQADCFAGVWANRSDAKWNIIEPGDVEAALRTATAIGDDKLQMQSRGYVVPDSFTHGSSEQRRRWFQIGLTEGTIAACNTFRAASL